MKTKITALLIGAAMLCSCERQFELHPEDYSNMIRLECVADACNDSVYIYPSICIPAHVRVKDIPSLQVTGLGIEVDGKFHNALLTENGWAVPGSVPEGAELKVKATAAGTADAYAETVVPCKPQIKVKCTPYEYVGSGWTTGISYNLKLNISIEDDDNDTGFYAVQIANKVIDRLVYTDEAKAMGYEDVEGSYVYCSTPEDISVSSFDEVESDDGVTIGYDGYRLGYSYSGPMRLYRTYELDGRDLFVSVEPDRSVKEPETIASRECIYKYQVRLYRVSPEIYRYAKAYNLERNNGLSSLGLAPVNFTFTNVVGGSGFFGAMTCTCSEWIDNPFHIEESTEE